MKTLVITGPDACGKDTQIERLSSSLRSVGKKVQVLSIQNSLADFKEIADMKTIDSFLSVFLLKFESTARTYFLLSLLRNAISRVDKKADLVIWNSYWYKYAASELAYGAPSQIWLGPLESFPQPDHIFVLQASLESCLLRRARWSEYESGGASTQLNLESFQKSMRKNLDDTLKTLPSPKTFIEGDRSEDVVATELSALVTKLGLV